VIGSISTVVLLVLTDAPRRGYSANESCSVWRYRAPTKYERPTSTAAPSPMRSGSRACGCGSQAWRHTEKWSLAGARRYYRGYGLAVVSVLGGAVRAEVATACALSWDRLGLTGTWWTAGDRVAIAAETRAASSCVLCAERKAALSPYGTGGSHDAVGCLDASVVDVVHRISSDPGRLTRRWFESVMASGLADTNFVELVGIVAVVVAINTLAFGLGVAPPALPVPQGGRPSRVRPAGAVVDQAWVPTVGPERATGVLAEAYRGMVLPAGILRALSLVPDEQVRFLQLGAALYLPWDALLDFSFQRLLTRPQMEVLAATVSAANDCFY
jgi:hypothetical protein